MNRAKIAIDCDDAASGLKDIIYNHVLEKGYDITDLKYTAEKPAPYPEIGYNLAKKIQSGEYQRGILLCGTGLGMCMIANKVKGIYAGVCHDVYSAERLCKSNDAQIITMGERVIGPEAAKKVIDAWLESEFAGGGSASKVECMRNLEEQSFNKAV